MKIVHQLVSVIIPTKNSDGTLEACLKSIKEQSYPLCEIIIVDNFSNDTTFSIAQKYTDKVFRQGPERSAQRNFAVSNCSGQYILFIDSDMVLRKQVIEECVNEVNKNVDIKGVIIPEKSFGKWFRAQCKKLERSFYEGVDWMEAARFFDRDVFDEVGGYDVNLVSGEDRDFSQKVEFKYTIGRVKSFIMHDEWTLSLRKSVKKKYYYAGKFAKYMTKKEWIHVIKQSKQTWIISRYSLFFSQPSKLFKNPLVGLWMLFLKTLEFMFGWVGYMVGKINSKFGF